MKSIVFTDERIWEKITQDRLKLGLKKNEDVVRAYQKLITYLKIQDELKKVAK